MIVDCSRLRALNLFDKNFAVTNDISGINCDMKKAVEDALF